MLKVALWWCSTPAAVFMFPWWGSRDLPDCTLLLNREMQLTTNNCISEEFTHHIGQIGNRELMQCWLSGIYMSLTLLKHQQPAEGQRLVFFESRSICKNKFSGSPQLSHLATCSFSAWHRGSQTSFMSCCA